MNIIEHGIDMKRHSKLITSADAMLWICCTVYSLYPISLYNKSTTNPSGGVLVSSKLSSSLPGQLLFLGCLFVAL